ncbi:hypothetical protein BDB01DRAFT_714016 [Pilobolus umbonatus]|nr:hypothetical protein BDB01DRAFT_714016 [Pilobolus umbonatus]
MSLASNRFVALLGDEDVEVDKLGNAKPIEKKTDSQPTRRETRRTGIRQPAVSPPSRRDRGNRKEVAETPFNAPVPDETSERKSRPRRSEGDGPRKFDRHSGTGIHDNEKKIKQGWGEAGTAEYQGAHDALDPNDPDAAETRGKFGEPEVEDNTKTLDEYLQERKNLHHASLPEARKPNEGIDDKQWTNTVVLKKEDDLYFVGNKETEAKLRNKAKKEKVYLEIDQPAHRADTGRGRGRGGRGGRGGRHNGRSREDQSSVNLSDSKAFPTLGA